MKVGVALVALMVAAAGCGTSSSETTTASQTPATTDAATPTPTTTTPTTASATTASLVEGNFAEVPIIVSAHGVLGWWSGDEWVAPPPDPADVPSGGGEDYQVSELNVPIVIAQGSEAIAGCDTIEGHVAIDIPAVNPQRQFPTSFPFAISAPWDLQPHTVELLDPPPAVYVEITAELLAERGIDDLAPSLLQVLRTDLEGDGVDEVVIVAERNGSGTLNPAFPGDYSIAFLRKVVADEVQTSVLGFFEVVQPEVEGSIIDLLAYRLDGIADLNGDGKMEIIVDDQYYEGAGTRVYEYVDDDLGAIAVLDVGCGV